MNRARLLAFLLIPLLAGCDIAVGVYFATKNKSSSKRAFVPPAPDTSFSLWVANLAAGVLTNTQVRDAIIANAGQPTAEWTKVNDFSGTTELDLTLVAPGPWDAILILATDAQIYHIDGFEVLDPTGTTIATPSTVFGDLVGTLGNAAGAPNALVADTQATATNKAFAFMRHTASVDRARVNLWKPTTRAEGDLEWVATYPLAGNQIAGGAAINSAGTTYLTLREASTILLLRYSPTGNVVQDTDTPPRDLTNLGPISTTSGHASVAIDLSNDDVFIATTELAGDIRLFKFVGNSDTASWTFPALQGAGVDRVEPNGLALNSNGDLVLAGGFDQQGLVGVQHYVRKHNKASGADMWVGSPPPAPPGDTTDTYWYAVAAQGANDIFAAGNLAQGLGIGPVDIYTQRLLDSSPASVTEVWNNPFAGGGANPGLGRSVGVDGAGNAFVAGFLTNANVNSVILRYANGAPPATLHLTSTRAGDDEILDIAVETDGTIYAVGYETNAGQGQDLVLLKIAPNNQILWKRTVHNGVGDDRGVSVMTTPLHVIVVGELTVGAGNKDIHVRRYVK